MVLGSAFVKESSLPRNALDFKARLQAFVLLKETLWSNGIMPTLRSIIHLVNSYGSNQFISRQVLTCIMAFAPRHSPTKSVAVITSNQLKS